MSGLPKTAILSPEEIREAIDEQVRAIVDSVIDCLGHRPARAGPGPHPARASTWSAAAAMLRGFDQRLAEETALPVHLVDAPLECVVLGAGKCLEAFESLKVLFMGAEGR